jgi:hypothetical protein
MSDGTGDGRRADPIFIHGILPRSGTNFLSDLLLLHPDCAPALDPVREDLFLDRSDGLTRFIDDVQAAWDPSWGSVTGVVRARLYSSLGDGLVAFLQDDRERRLVTKSPSVRHLDRFFTFFPDASLLVLVRDGRAVTQSAMRTFGWTFERAAHAWAEAAEEVDLFRRTHAGSSARWHLVRYEDLLEDLDASLPEVLRSVGLDPTVYDMDAARRLPVRGSSFHHGPDRTDVHWDAVPRTETFAPTERWREWDRERIDRFEWLAGPQLRAFGYATVDGGRRSAGLSLRHASRDASWNVRRVAAAGRRAAGTASRPLRRRLGIAR